jgi:hypothetical protein
VRIPGEAPRYGDSGAMDDNTPSAFGELRYYGWVIIRIRAIPRTIRTWTEDLGIGRSPKGHLPPEKGMPPTDKVRWGAALRVLLLGGEVTEYRIARWVRRASQSHGRGSPKYRTGWRAV